MEKIFGQESLALPNDVRLWKEKFWDANGLREYTLWFCRRLCFYDYYSRNLFLFFMVHFRGGGGGTSICMHIGYVPREKPLFSALNFRSGAYNFHKWHNILLRSITTFFVVPETIIFSQFLYVQAILRRPRSAYCSQPERFSAPGPFFLAAGQTRLQSVPETPTFTLELAPEPGHFSLCRGTYLSKFGGEYPPPPPG